MSVVEIVAAAFLSLLGVTTSLYPALKWYQRRMAQAYFENYLSNISHEPLREQLSAQFTNPVTKGSIASAAVFAVLYVAALVVLIQGANGG
jgi:hypothetical protein